MHLYAHLFASACLELNAILIHRLKKTHLSTVDTPSAGSSSSSRHLLSQLNIFFLSAKIQLLVATMSELGWHEPFIGGLIR